LGANQYINKIGKPEAVYSELAHGIRTVVKGKKAEEALRDSEKEKSAVLDSMSELVIHQDLKHRILWMNRKAADSVNMKVEQVKGRYCHELWAKRVNPCVACPLEESIKTGQPQQGEMTTPDSRIWSISGYPIKDANGNVTSVVEVTTEITTQKKAEEALRESEKKCRELSELLPEVIFETDATGLLTFVNQAAFERFGYSREDFDKGLNALQMLVPEDRNRGKENIGRVLRGETVGSTEYMAMKKDGTTFTCIINSTPIIHENKPVGIRGMIVDITERKKAEDALRESEAKYRELINGMNDTALVIDSDGNIIDANNTAVKVLGYSREELLSMGIQKLDATLTVEEIKGLAKKMKTVELLVFETVHTTKDGKTIPVEISASHVTYRGKQAILSIARDITERKKTDEKLKESERKYRLLTENTTDVVYIQDMNLSVTYASPSVEKLSGYTPEELSKLRPENFMTPESFERGVVDFKEAITLAAEEWDYEIPLKQYEYVRKDGSTFWGELKMKMLRDSHNNLVGVQGTLRDITERKEAEKKLDGMMNELVTINEKLGVVGKLTRHDARNKLSVIANNVYLVKQKLATDHSSLEYLGDIESAIDQMEKIFDFSRTYEMLGVEELSYVDVEKSVEEAAILFSGMNGITLVNDCYGLAVMADSLLRQLFYNLIDDTLKHGEKVSQIRVYYEEGENQLKLIYEDDGIGIPEDEKQNIFREGYGKGTGYGLYLIKKICEDYGWIIQETGVLGKGAQFTMTIPKTNKSGKISYIIN